MSDDPTPPVQVNVHPVEPTTTITLREVYDEVKGLSLTIAQHLGPLSEDVHELKRDVAGLKDRESHYITKESLRWAIATGFAALAAIATLLAVVLRH